MMRLSLIRSLKSITNGERVGFFAHLSLLLVRYEVDNLRKELGIISKTVAQKMKDSKGQDKCEEEKAQANAVKEKIELAEKQLDEIDGE